MQRALLFLCFGAFFLFACGSDEPQHKSPPSIATPFGEAQEVTDYLTEINPHVRGVSEIQQQIDQRVGSAGQATGQNLAAVMQELQPELEKHQEALKNLNAPPQLAGMHADILHLVSLRLEAYSTTVKGWETEQETGDLSLYTKAQDHLNEANTLIVALNQQMQKVNSALLQATQSPPQVASP